MPWPGTSIPAPWDPAPTAAPPDTSQRDKLVATLGAQHGGLVGTPSTPTVKNPKDPSGGEIPGPYDLYSFADGSTLEIAPTGEVSKYTPKATTGTVAGWTDITQVRNPDQTITYYGKDPKDPGGPLKPVEGLPTSAAPTSTAQTATPSAELDKLDARGNVIPPGDTTTKPVFTRDPKTGTTTQLKDQPTATSQLDRIDAQGKVIPPGDTTTKPVSLRDPVTGTVIDVPKDAAGSVTAVGDTMYVIKPDGSSTPVVGPDGKPLTKPKDASQFNVPGVGLVNYDPSSGKANVLIAAPTGVQAKDLKPEVRGGKTYIPVDGPNGTITWQESDLPTDTQYTIAQNDPRSPNVLLIDQQGNSKFVSKGPDWKPPPSPAAGQALTPDTTAPFVVTIGDNGQPQFTKNTNQLSISDAQKQLIQQLGLKVASGDMSEKAAQDLISSATSTLTAQAAQQNAQANMLQAQTQQQNLGVTAAGDVLSNVQNAAQTGAGMLQNRVTAATGALNNVLNVAGQAKNLMNVPAGLGQQLVGGLQDWATQLGGGADVYNSAANLVRRADPTNQLGGDAAGAYAALGQMLQKYRDLTGQPHPAEALANQPQANTGFSAPAGQPNLFNPQASTAAMNAAGFQDTPQGRLAAQQSNPGLLQTPQPGAQQQSFAPPPGGYAQSQPGTYGPLTGNMPFMAPMTTPTSPSAPKVTVSVG